MSPLFTLDCSTSLTQDDPSYKGLRCADYGVSNWHKLILLVVEVTCLRHGCCSHLC